MDRTSFGATAGMIGQIIDPAQLTAMMRNPRYAGYTSVIVARLQEINQMRQAAQGATPQAPTVAQQALQNAQQAQQPQQGMAKGGIVAFKDGGKVKRFAKGDLVKSDEDDPYTAGWGTMGKPLSQEQWATLPEERKARLLAQAKNPTKYTTGLESLYSTGFGADQGTPSIAQQIGPRLMESGFSGAGAPSAATNLGAIPSGARYSDNSAAANAARLEGERTAADRALPTFEPISSRALGIPSYGGLAALRAGDAGPRRSMKDIYADIESMRGPNKYLDEMDKGRAAGRAEDLNMALIRGGLGMAQAAGEHPQTGILGSLATGAGAGLEQFTAAQKERNQQLREMAKLDRMERSEAARLAASEYGADARAARQEALARMQLGVGAKPFQAQEAAVQRATTALINEQRQKGINVPSWKYPFFEMQARSMLAGTTPQMQAAELRQQQAAQQARAKYVADQSKLGVPAQRAAQDYDAYVAKYGMAPGGMDDVVATYPGIQ